MTDSFDQVQPAFRAAVAAAGRALCRDGALEAADGAERLTAVENGVSLQLLVRRGKILRAGHEGAGDPAQRAVLDVFCQVIEGLPMQEVADHGGHHVVARLRDPDCASTVRGILTPWNADPLFHLPIRLLRAAHADYRAGHETRSVENFWNPTISKAWLRLDEAAQIARLESILSGFLVENGLEAGDARVVGVENNIRIVLAFAESVAYDRKPPLLMDFERRVRAATGDRFEVFAEEMKDSNRIRRL